MWCRFHPYWCPGGHIPEDLVLKDKERLRELYRRLIQDSHDDADAASDSDFDDSELDDDDDPDDPQRKRRRERRAQDAESHYQTKLQQTMDQYKTGEGNRIDSRGRSAMRTANTKRRSQHAAKVRQKLNSHAKDKSKGVKSTKGSRKQPGSSNAGIRKPNSSSSSGSPRNHAPRPPKIKAYSSPSSSTLDPSSPHVSETPISSPTPPPRRRQRSPVRMEIDDDEDYDDDEFQASNNLSTRRQQALDALGGSIQDVDYDLIGSDDDEEERSRARTRLLNQIEIPDEEEPEVQAGNVTQDDDMLRRLTAFNAAVDNNNADDDDPMFCAREGVNDNTDDQPNGITPSADQQPSHPTPDPSSSGNQEGTGSDDGNKKVKSEPEDTKPNRSDLDQNFIDLSLHGDVENMEVVDDDEVEALPGLSAQLPPDQRFNPYLEHLRRYGSENKPLSLDD